MVTYFIASVWLISGLLCKVLNVVPRHEQIVAIILGKGHSGLFTLLIGMAEIIMGIWVLSRFKKQLNAIIQMGVIALMNILEFILAPGLLLWGRLNIVFACMFIGLIYYNEFMLAKRLTKRATQ